MHRRGGAPSDVETGLSAGINLLQQEDRGRKALNTRGRKKSNGESSQRTAGNPCNTNQPSSGLRSSRGLNGEAAEGGLVFNPGLPSEGQTTKRLPRFRS